MHTIKKVYLVEKFLSQIGLQRELTRARYLMTQEKIDISSNISFLMSRLTVLG